METAIRFIIGGRNALFKKPDVNSSVYFTYNNIHKVALLGMLGAIVGLEGWRDYKAFEQEKRQYPEFYEILRSLSVSILPMGEKGDFPKKIQYFNNSVGYASFEDGGNLQVFEQWLENPQWEIYVKNNGIEHEVWDKLCNMLLAQACVYIPYLGKNDFPAVISDVSIVNLEKTSSKFCNSIFIGDLSQLQNDSTLDGKRAYYFTEFAPVGLEPDINLYSIKRMIYTNCEVLGLENMYCEGSKNLYFY